MDSAGLRSLIRDIPDHPVAGVTYRDVTPLLGDAAGFAATIDGLASPFVGRCDMVVGIEARGFIFGAPVAHRLGVGFVPIRKPAKLPHETVSRSYALEYGVDTLEMHRDALGGNHRVLIVDDVLATGGTAEAAAALVALSGASLCGFAFVIEIAAFGGRARLGEHLVEVLVRYD